MAIKSLSTGVSVEWLEDHILEIIGSFAYVS